MESAELIAILREVRERVRAQRPETGPAGIPVADLMGLVHARDSALGKVAAIGTVNPRPGGLGNSVVQAWKRLVARVLDWHVREQVEFNRKIVLRYVPDKRCLELKSYKMYLNAYRNLGIFQENVVNRVLRDVVKAADPKGATVVGDFTPRGGLSTIVTATWSRKRGKR